MRSIMLALALLLIATSALAQPVYPGASPTSAPIYCNRSLQGSQPAGTYELVPLHGGESIYVCGQNVTATGASTWQLVYGAGTLCATGLTPLTPAFNLSGNSPLATRSPVAGHFLPRGMALCAVTTGATQWVVFYSQF